MKYTSKSSSETVELGEKLGKALKPGMVVALEGDLGGGKTTFTKGIAKGLGIKDDITSPSFSLEKIYSVVRSPKSVTRLYHFDFYRIENPKDMMNYELIEALEDEEAVVVVEWAEKIEKDLPDEKLVVKFHYIEEDEREIELNAFGNEYQKIITNFQ